MKTPVEKMIEAVENGYYSNETLWNEWKKTLLEEERELLQHNVSNNEVSVCLNPDHVICCLKQDGLCTEDVSDCEFRQTDC